MKPDWTFSGILDVSKLTDSELSHLLYTAQAEARKRDKTHSLNNIKEKLTLYNKGVLSLSEVSTCIHVHEREYAERVRLSLM